MCIRDRYLDPSYDLVTYNRMDYMSNSTAQPETEDAEYEKTEISFGEQKNRAEISNQAAFALNEFGMQRMETLDEGKGLKGTFHFWDQMCIRDRALPSLLISALNGILAVYSQSYVVVLGIYYKLQTFIYLTANGIVQGLSLIHI